MTAISVPHNAGYRADIDGLRAIAVLSVILFHMDKTVLPGGFVGVDIFFVISGFLISRNILVEIERGAFSIREFYRRRVKRIAPAMFTVMLATLIVAQFIMVPGDAGDAERVAQSAFWSALSVANAYFWLQSDVGGYFATASTLRPLLHLWSLAVEEQFYILWPLILMAVYPVVRGRYLLPLVLGVAACSFAAGEALFTRMPSFVYYMLPTRAGELMLGALVAISVLKGVERVLSPKLVLATAIMGAGLIAGSLALLSEEQVFPGLRAIPPTLGTALLLLAGHCSMTPISRILALKPLVWVGLISYSAYLWHWPLLAFYRYGHPTLDLIAGATIFALTVGLAWITYLYVEQPVRRSNASALAVVTKWYVAPAAAISVIALAAQYLDGYGLYFWSDDYRARVAKEAGADADVDSSIFCMRWRIDEKDTVSDRCIAGDTKPGNPTVLLWGDSNADHYVGLLDVLGKASGFKFRNLTHGACPPIFDDPTPYLMRDLADHRIDCLESLALIKATIHQYPVVVIAGSWLLYQSKNPDFLSAVFKTADTLTSQGKRVILVGKAPVFHRLVERCRLKALRYPSLDCTPKSEPLDADVAAINARLREFAEKTRNVDYVDPASHLCSEGMCLPAGPDGEPLFRDANHLSMKGSFHLGRLIVDSFSAPKPLWRIGKAGPIQ